MRVVVDTNVVISGLLWSGPSRQLLDAARSEEIQLFTSYSLLAELEDVLLRPRLAPRLSMAGTSVPELVLGYVTLATIVTPAEIDPAILRDPDDDAVLACAVAAGADMIVSGDLDLRDLGSYQGIEIVAPATLLERLAT